MTRRLRHDALWSLAGTVLSAAASIVGMKVVTRLVPTADFGSASLVLGLVALANGIIIGPLITAGQREYFEYHRRNLEGWFEHKFDRLIVAAVALSIALYAAAIAVIPSSVSLATDVAAILGASALGGQALQTRLGLRLEVRRAQKSLALANAISKGLTPALMLLLLFGGMGAASAVVLAQAIPGAIVGSLWRVPGKKPLAQAAGEVLPRRRDMYKGLFALGWALPASWLGMWGVTTAGRYVIDAFLPTGAVGVYAFNAGLWALGFSLLNGWLETFIRPILFSSAAAGDTSNVFSLVTIRAGICITVTVIVLALTHPIGIPLLYRFFGPAYSLNESVHYLLIIAGGLQAAGYALAAALLALRRGPAVAVAAVIAATVNIVGSLFAVPIDGIRGAASASVLAYVVWNVTMAVVLLRYAPQHDLRRAAA